jgi:hypothetical protein
MAPYFPTNIVFELLFHNLLFHYFSNDVKSSIKLDLLRQYWLRYCHSSIKLQIITKSKSLS